MICENPCICRIHGGWTVAVPFRGTVRSAGAKGCSRRIRSRCMLSHSGLKGGQRGASAYSASCESSFWPTQEANTMPSISRPGSNSWVTHEMAEMALNCWGQWELNNQPSWIMQHVQVRRGIALPRASASLSTSARHHVDQRLLLIPG